MVRLKTRGKPEMRYVCGDHVAILPANSSRLVKEVLDRVTGVASPDDIVCLEIDQGEGWCEIIYFYTFFFLFCLFVISFYLYICFCSTM